MHRAILTILVSTSVVACGSGGPDVPSVETGEASTDPGTTATTTDPPTSTGGTDTSSSAGGSSTGTTAVDGTTFIPMPDAPDSECDVFAQDCPRGEKCSAYANDGGNSWNAAKCVPVMENPAQPGDPCFVVGNGVSGSDNCDLGSYCWDTNAENIGVCVALCTGTAQAPICEPGFTCAIVYDGVLNLCLGSCDPLAQDCMNDDLCIGIALGEGFLCVLEGCGEECGQAHDPCEYANACDPGLVCLDSSAAVECDPQASGCCEPFCDLTAPNTCPGQGQLCNPWFEPGTAPEGFEHIGYCAVPM